MHNRNILLRIILFPLALLYSVVTALRNLLYDRGWLRSFTLGVPVISVGNFTAGGTGKTPFVISLCAILQNHGFKVGIITRGYKRRSRGQVVVSTGNGSLVNAQIAGDEPFLIAGKTRNAVVVCDRNRLAAGTSARESYGCNLLIADDAFQHRKMERNIDIVLWDASTDPSLSRILPLGLMRESWRALQRATILVFTRTNKIAENQATFFSRQRADLPQFCAALKIDRIENPFNCDVLDATLLTGTKIFAFCGLGNPDQFFATVKNQGPKELIVRRFADHHQYSADDLSKMALDARRNRCDYIFTTEKDYMNLPQNSSATGSIYVVKIRMLISPALELQIVDKIKRTPQRGS